MDATASDVVPFDLKMALNTFQTSVIGELNHAIGLIRRSAPEGNFLTIDAFNAEFSSFRNFVQTEIAGIRTELAKISDFKRDGNSCVDASQPLPSTSKRSSKLSLSSVTNAAAGSSGFNMNAAAGSSGFNMNAAAGSSGFNMNAAAGSSGFNGQQQTGNVNPTFMDTANNDDVVDLRNSENECGLCNEVVDGSMFIMDPCGHFPYCQDCAQGLLEGVKRNAAALKGSNGAGDPIHCPYCNKVVKKPMIINFIPTADDVVEI